MAAQEDNPGEPIRDPVNPARRLERRTVEGVSCAEVYVETFTQQQIRSGDFAPSQDQGWFLLARVTGDSVTIFPVKANPYALSYLAPKMGRIQSITVRSSAGWTIPETLEDFESMLYQLPTGFSVDSRYGLGLTKGLHVIWQTLAQIPMVNAIIIEPGSHVLVQGSSVHLGDEVFDQVRRDVDNVNRRYRDREMEDKRLVAHNRLLPRIDEGRFPPKERKLRPGTLFEVIKLAEKQARSKKDQSATVQFVRSHARTIAEDAPEELMSLKSQIELVTLDQLIAKFEAMLGKSLREESWQSFFRANPFILSLAFPHPVFVVQDQAYVGGKGVEGCGAKIADFLMSQQYTGNLAIVEIKRPDTKLVLETAYRGDNVYGPNSDLSGAITQVLDQRYRLCTQFATLTLESKKLRDHTPTAVNCIVIAGTTPPDEKKRQSFDLFRNATKDVDVVTFDDLLEKLKQIQRLFSSPAISPVTTPSNDVPF